MLRLAMQTAANCRDIEWYGVGCVITDPAGKVLSTGYTGERMEGGKMRHAEDVAIEKALESGADLKAAGTTLYSTLEPCSVRASKKKPCTVRIIESGITTVVYGSREPFDPALGIQCDGHRTMSEAGIEVIELTELAGECLASALSRRKPQR